MNNEDQLRSERIGPSHHLTCDSQECVGHIYEIYAHRDGINPSTDAYVHMQNWLDFYELSLGRPFQPDDFLFPTVSTNGSIDPTRNMSHNAVQTTIHVWAKAAGLPNWARFTTHCFRRGGAQYRFMYAPLSERWTLARIQWWGGWAEGEKVSSLLVCFELASNRDYHRKIPC